MIQTCSKYANKIGAFQLSSHSNLKRQFTFESPRLGKDHFGTNSSYIFLPIRQKNTIATEFSNIMPNNFGYRRRTK